MTFSLVSGSPGLTGPIYPPPQVRNRVLLVNVSRQPLDRSRFAWERFYEELHSPAYAMLWLARSRQEIGQRAWYAQGYFDTMTGFGQPLWRVYCLHDPAQADSEALLRTALLQWQLPFLFREVAWQRVC